MLNNLASISYHRRIKFAAVFLLMLIGVFLRFFNIEEFATFGHDNSRDLILAQKLFKYSEFIYRGPIFSIVWAHLSFIYYYIVSPFYVLMDYHPLAPAILSSAFNVIALLVLGYAAYKMFGYLACVLATVIYSFSFLVIKEGAFGLNPCLMPMFALLYLYCADRIRLGFNNYIYGLGLSVAMLLSFHPSGFFIIPVTIVLYFFLKPKFSKKELAGFMGVILLFAGLPYLIQEKKFDGWDIKQFMNFLTKNDSPSSIGVVQYIINYFSILLNNISETFFATHGLLVNFVSAIVLGSTAYIVVSRRHVKAPLSMVAVIIIVYLITFGLVIKFDKVGTHEAWFQSVIIPWIILYIAGLVSSFRNALPLVLTISLVAIIQNLFAYFNYIPESDTYIAQLNMAQVIRNDSKGRDFDIYGEDPEPIFYLSWYFESNPALKGKYYSWIKWSKQKDSKLVYFLDGKYSLNEPEENRIKTLHNLNSTSQIYEFAERHLYKIE